MGRVRWRWSAPGRSASGQGIRLASGLSILTATILAGCAESPVADRLPPLAQEDFHLFLLAGQSNMAGRGSVEARDRTAHPRVWVLGPDFQWRPATDPLHFDRPNAGVGPGRTFGIAVAESDTAIHVGLIPAAVGGTAIQAWQRGGVHAVTGERPYEEAIARAREAMKSGQLKAILWHQGESDADPESAHAYAERLEATIAAFREDLGDPDLPVLLGQLGRFAERPWDPGTVEVDGAHHALANRMNGVLLVSSHGLDHAGDTLHFSAAAARELGSRYARTYLQLSR